MGRVRAEDPISAMGSLRLFCRQHRTLVLDGGMPATNKQSGEKVHLHQLSRELEIPLPDFIAPLVDLARELEFNVTFL